jgi:monofunctional biosynthetic peptidoglycan transglycosylase
MVGQWIEQGKLEKDWLGLEEISPHLPLSVIAAEDARFCSHYGFDFIEIKKALADDERRRGASTITQQVAKNVFLWPDASWLRKGLEAGFAMLVEAFWPKARIIEVYLNVAEFGPGIFGAEAAAQAWFGKSAAALSRNEAARLAAILPNPRERSASRPSNFVAGRARSIAGGAETVAANGGADCISGG